MIDTYSLLDRKKAKLLLFVAANMMRIPGICPLESDVVALSASFTDLRQKVLFIKTEVSSKSLLKSNSTNIAPSGVINRITSLK